MNTYMQTRSRNSLRTDFYLNKHLMAFIARLPWKTRVGIFTWSYLGRVAWAATILVITLFIINQSTFWSGNVRSQREIAAEILQRYPLAQKKPLPKKRSFCPDNEVMKSSKVTKLGRYPTKQRFLAIGIASVMRPSGENYLLQTIQSLINNTSELDRNDIYVVIFLADLHESAKSDMKEELTRTFGKYIDQGFLQVIEAFPGYYPELNNIKEKYGDSASRRTWRSKENLDNVFVMCYCKDLSRYYIHLEDDVKSSPSFFPKLQDFIASQNDSHWPILNVASKGSVARGFQSRDLENLASFVYLMYDEMPLDWLMNNWVKMKYPSKRYTYRKEPLASLFEHIGVTSSLAEKTPRVKGLEDFFDRYNQKYKGLNLPATVASSLATHQGNPQDSYNKGSGYFWSAPPQKDDYVLIKFNTATVVQKVFVETGSNGARNDLLYFAVLQVSFQAPDITGETQLSNGTEACRKFETVGRFVKGKVEINFGDTRGINCLRILVTQHQKERIFLREIDVW